VDRRTFLKTTIVAALSAPLLVYRDEQRYQVLRRHIQGVLDAFHARHGRATTTVLIGEEAINCYERGLARHATITRVSLEPALTEAQQRALAAIKWPTVRLLNSPHIGPWDVVACV
jgi:hypothetical protein